MTDKETIRQIVQEAIRKQVNEDGDIGVGATTTGSIDRYDVPMAPTQKRVKPSTVNKKKKKKEGNEETEEERYRYYYDK